MKTPSDSTPAASGACALELPPPDAIRYRWIDDQQTLEDACRRWRQRDHLALDTEFVRERTFYPALGLLQVSDGDEISLVDPLAISDLSPFTEMLTDPSVVKILHSCSEDLEVFDVHLGELPSPLYDTQVAATLLRDSPPPGYARLIDELFGIEVPKGETRSKWLRRPLREAQLHYAALDVAYLPAARRELDARLRERGRRGWLEEEMDSVLAAAAASTPDEEIYLGVGRAPPQRRPQRGALRELFAWRQREARKRDLPRSFVVKDKALIQLATDLPRRHEQLADVQELDRRTINRHGRAILDLLHAVYRLPEDELPQRLPRTTDLSKHKPLVKRLRRLAQERAGALGLAPETLANRRTLESVARRHVEGRSPLPESLRDGWRHEALGRFLLDALEE